MAKTKALISFAATAKLICVFVFAYAKNRFSHDESLFISMVSISLTKSYLSTGQVSMRIVVALIYDCGYLLFNIILLNFGVGVPKTFRTESIFKLNHWVGISVMVDDLLIPSRYHCLSTEANTAMLASVRKN